MSIPLACPSITDAERNAVLSVLNTNTLSIGPNLEGFETAFAATLGAKAAVAVNSGTSGLHLAMKAIGIQPGDEVITTPFSFVASANCVLFERATPVFVDIDANTYNIDTRQIPAAVSRKSRALLPVHVFGRPCDMLGIQEIATQFRLRVVEDSCEAIGATCFGKPTGTLGDIGVFAFYPNKQITTGEGGMIVTNDLNYASLCKSWRNQGRSATAAWLQHEMLGYNYRMSELNCALGLAQLGRVPEILNKRREAARLYSELLTSLVPDVILPFPAEPGHSISWFVYVVRLDDSFERADRDSILHHLQARGIGCSNYFTPIHLQPFYRRTFGFAPGDFPVAEHVSERTIALPFFTDIAEEQIRTACLCLREAITSVRSQTKPVFALGGNYDAQLAAAPLH